MVQKWDRPKKRRRYSPRIFRHNLHEDRETGKSPTVTFLTFSNQRDIFHVADTPVVWQMSFDILDNICTESASDFHPPMSLAEAQFFEIIFFYYYHIQFETRHELRAFPTCDGTLLF